MTLSPSYTLNILFIALLALTTATRIWLGSRHIGFVLGHRNQVPEAFANNISLEAHQKAADYTSAKTKLALTETLAQAILLLLLTVGHGLQNIDTV